MAAFDRVPLRLWSPGCTNVVISCLEAVVAALRAIIGEQAAEAGPKSVDYWASASSTTNLTVLSPEFIAQAQVSA